MPGEMSTPVPRCGNRAPLEEQPGTASDLQHVAIEAPAVPNHVEHVAVLRHGSAAHVLAVPPAGLRVVRLVYAFDGGLCVVRL